LVRFKRGLTKNDRQDIALLILLLSVGFACVAGWYGLPDMPSLWSVAGAAQMPPAPATQTDVVPAPAAPIPLPAFIAPTKPISAPVTPRIVKFKGETYRYVKTLRMRVTAYAPDTKSCWPYPGTTTASGKSVKFNGGRLVAADARLLPFGALVAVPDYNNGNPVPVQDRGGAIKGQRLDVLLPTDASADAWGVRYESVDIYLPIR